MIECERDSEGNITGVVEYLLFDEEDRLTEEGSIMFIGEVEINPQHRRKGILRRFVQRLLAKYPQAQKCMFYREKKYPGRGVRIYERKYWEQLTKE